MLPETYKKVIVQRFSRDPREAMAVVDTKMYPPGPNELLVKNIYVGTNFTDVPRMLGLADKFQSPPFDAGIDALGEVVQIGSAVTDFSVGDKVITAFFGNGFREYSLIDARLAVKTNHPTKELLGAVISGAMASIMLHVVAGYTESTPPQKVLVTAGLGGSGHYVVQLAKMAGHHVVTTCATDEEAEYLKAYDCDRVIVRDKENPEDVIPAEYPDGLNLVVESFGGEFFNLGLDNLAPRGQLISAGALVEHTNDDSHIHTIDIYNKLIWKSATIHGFNLIDYANHIRKHTMMISELTANGKIKTLLDPVEFKGIDSVIDAMAHMMSWKTRGKVVIEL